MTDRIPGAPGRCKAVVTGQELQKLQAGEEFAITLRRDDQPIREGTPYSKASVLPDALAAKLCPGVQDPTPGDAFAALQNQKADTVRQAAGEHILLADAAHTPLMGLRIIGSGRADGCVGDSGSVTVKVQGKNIADVRKFTTDSRLDTPTTTPELSNSYGTTISATSGDSITVTQSKYTNTSNVTSFSNGFFAVGCYCPWKSGDKVTISFNYDIKTNPLNSSDMLLFIDDKSTASNISVKDAKTGLYYCTHTVLTEQEKENNWHYIEVRVGGKSGVFSNFQVEYGNTATEYEPYQEPQTLTIPTAAGGQTGLEGDGLVQDEIDLARGVLIHRVFEEKEYALPDDVMEAYAKLHTYAPTTVLTNDAGADMELTYYTPTTAVQMVQGAANKGKTFTVDDHGCVTLTPDDPVIASGVTELDGVTWYYRKWASGMAELWCYAQRDGRDTEEMETPRILETALPLPFPLAGFLSCQLYAQANRGLADMYNWSIVTVHSDAVYVSLKNDAGSPGMVFDLHIIGSWRAVK